MPRRSLQGRTCSVSRDGGRARARQPSRRSIALPLTHPHVPSPQYAAHKTAKTWNGEVVQLRSAARINSPVRRGRGVLTACRTHREPVPGARWRHPCRHTVPQPARTPHQTVGRPSSEKLSAVRCASDLEPMLHDRTRRTQHCSSMRTDPLDRSLPAHRRGTLSGMDAAPEPTGTYLQRVPRWWAGKGPAAKPQIACFGFGASSGSSTSPGLGPRRPALPHQATPPPA